VIKDFIYKHKVDNLISTEVCSRIFWQLPWYTAIYNIGTEQSGTVIIIRGSLSVTEMEKLRTRRGGVLPLA